MSRDYCDHLIDMLAPWANITARKMFGGFGLYRADVMFGLVLDDTLYFKVSDANRADYEAAGSVPFVYEAKAKRVTVSYWTVPAEALDDDGTLCAWAANAYAVALEAWMSKKRPKAASGARNGPVHRLRSLGPKTRAWLKEAGIEGESDLRALGAVAAYRRLKIWNPRLITFNMLWALHAALTGISPKDIAPETKAWLKRQASGE